ncbi:zinc metallopeptidase [Blattabacterium cuenoti]|uniref:zinc metallopeptidase n=1 Tax=Blattabacterium cuenoti TaxID=1653831 RepID=UPI00163C3155|nr:zinc metallopeptidase [Blattabacterium cuenoti]
MIYYLIVGITFTISIIVSKILKDKFQIYSECKLQNNMSGKEIAEKMLSDCGIYDVEVISIEGFLTDYYDPINKTVNLSEKVYYENTAASASVAAHECGHALQHKHGYNMLKLRNYLIPFLNFSSRFTSLLIISGLTVFYSSGGKSSILLKMGLCFFFLAVLFSFVTLPIEFDASKRALNWLKEKNIVSYQEYDQAKDSLKWASMTYIISAMGSLVQFIYFLSVLNRKEED